MNISAAFCTKVSLCVMRVINIPCLHHHLFSAVFDTLYLIYYIMDYGIIGTFMRSQSPQNELTEPLWYRVSYPYILWPLKWMFMSGTIFMVMAISAERYRAICSPLTHRPKFWPYIFIVIFFSCKLSNQITVSSTLHLCRQRAQINKRVDSSLVMFWPSSGQPQHQILVELSQYNCTNTHQHLHLHRHFLSNQITLSQPLIIAARGADRQKSLASLCLSCGHLVVNLYTGEWRLV